MILRIARSFAGATAGGWPLLRDFFQERNTMVG
jgi:hypothetical protein